MLLTSLTAVSFNIAPSSFARSTTLRMQCGWDNDILPQPAETMAHTANFRGVVSPTEQWQFQHSSQARASAALGATRDVDGSVATLQQPKSPTPLAAADTTAMTRAPNGVVSQTEAWAFKHGCGYGALGSTAAADGFVAMITQQPNAPPARSSSSALANPTPSALAAKSQSPSAGGASADQLVIGGGSYGPQSGGPEEEWSFRHGVGGMALGHRGDFRHGTPATRSPLGSPKRY